MTRVTVHNLAYDSTVPTSVKHLVRRNAVPYAAVCGLKLTPGRYIRSVEIGEATCERCLWVHAQAIAVLAHTGQYDMDGLLHVEHVGRVVAALEPDLQAQTVAWLHDVVEDSGWTLEALREEHFPRKMIEAVGLLTWDKRADARYDYIERIATTESEAGKLARTVKIADLVDNYGRTSPSEVVRRAGYSLDLQQLRRADGQAQDEESAA